ncbi:SPFH domain-containing protein [Nocardia uniformis]|uniref:SPFH domain-containing protein n=1 Tax=Nocardia uniformis TaxID=53432 RepID=A0A849C673_9NOCA|nr:SPFH domain-containing protein [Nocardia uniformis]NNH73216.1 SPFH domain-containing protein [Nocardia uniformis]
MAWFEREFIAVPPSHKNQLVHKWPDVNIRRFSRVIVDAGEIALFVHTGQVAAVMTPGRHQVDATELPGLGALLDKLSGGNAYRAELYFVGTKEFPGNKFGGRLDDILDPRSEQIVTLRVFGEYALAVRDPAALITGLTGTVDLTDPGSVISWCSDLLLRSMRITVAAGTTGGRWPILGLAAYLPEIDTEVLSATNQQLRRYGLLITRLGNFDINLAPEDTDRLKRLAKDVRYIQLAGGFQPYAAGELALGAGQGMALGGGSAVAGGFLGAGLGLSAAGQQLGTAPPASGPPPGHAPARGAAGSNGPLAAEDAGQVECAQCQVGIPAGSSFCTGCGRRLAARLCTGCGATLGPGARFCGACGSPADT